MLHEAMLPVKCIRLCRTQYFYVFKLYCFPEAYIQGFEKNQDDAF